MWAVIDRTYMCTHEENQLRADRTVVDRPYMCTHEENQLRADRLIRAVIDSRYSSEHSARDLVALCYGLLRLGRYFSWDV